MEKHIFFVTVAIILSLLLLPLGISNAYADGANIVYSSTFSVKYFDVYIDYGTRYIERGTTTMPVTIYDNNTIEIFSNTYNIVMLRNQSGDMFIVAKGVIYFGYGYMLLYIDIIWYLYIKSSGSIYALIRDIGYDESGEPVWREVVILQGYRIITPPY